MNHLNIMYEYKYGQTLADGEQLAKRSLVGLVRADGIALRCTCSLSRELEDKYSTTREGIDCTRISSQHQKYLTRYSVPIRLVPTAEHPSPATSNLTTAPNRSISSSERA